MKAIILAGGEGIRLRPLTNTKPKPMLPVANKPIIEYLLENLARHNIKEIILTLSYQAKLIQDYLGDGSRYGVELNYLIEEKPLGTASAVKNAEKYLNDTFIVASADVITKIDFLEQFNFHKRKGGAVTLAAKKVENPWDFGIIDLDSQNRVKRFKEKPKPLECFSNLINAGQYVLEPEILDFISMDGQQDFSKDIFPALLNSKELYGFVSSAYWIDIGRAENYLKANRDLLDIQLKESDINSEIKKNVQIYGPVVIGNDTIIEDDVRILGPALIGNESYIGKDSFLGKYSVLGNKLHICKKAQIGNSVIMNDTSIGEASMVYNSIIAEASKIASRAAILSDIIA